MATFHITIRSGKPGTSLDHCEYILRKGKNYSKIKQHDLVATDKANLPKWANDDPCAFFKAADQYERKNAAAYKELEIALPNELSLEQNKELLKDFTTALYGNKPMAMAIHMPKSSLTGVDQPHGHFMYSERTPDGIDRGADRFFSRHNSAKPELGGCKKDGCGMSALEIKKSAQSVRKHLADTINKHLELNGHAARVDHRSFKDRGIDKQPEKYLGALRVAQMTVEDKRAFLSKRTS